MLTELRIKNFAIIESLTLPLARGFNVLSGETGAGKSIIVGALGLLLGERASADLIRSGADKATVEGVFDIGDLEDVAALADERGIEVENGTLVLKREVAANGRGRAWINGTTVTASVLVEIGRQLVNLHGQHDARTLLDNESQRRILDAFGGAERQAAAVRATHKELSDVRREIGNLSARRADAEKRADYLRHVAKEIEDARLSTGEDTKLEDEARVLENADELRTLATTLNELLSAEEGSVLSQLGAAQRPLSSIERIDPAAARMQELFDAGFYALQELARSVEDYAASVALNVGHEDRPLARVASGGELSRVMLALKTILARVDQVPTLIFDEVDAGIGGRVGLQVGDTLRRVAKEHQVFAISHLPQIAARAHHHIVVAKGARGGVTTADITVLEGTSRVNEIARMLGGDPESKVSRAHAKELLESAAGA